MATCRSCGARIFWARMPSGKRNPLDVKAEPSRGNVFVESNGEARYIDDDEREQLIVRGMSGGIRLSHFATCPQAGKWRKKDKAA